MRDASISQALYPRGDLPSHSQIHKSNSFLFSNPAVQCKQKMGYGGGKKREGGSGEAKKKK